MVWMISRSCNRFPLSSICREVLKSSSLLKCVTKYQVIRSLNEIRGDVVSPNQVMGIQYLRDARINKGLAFSIRERQLLGIHGLQPAGIRTQDDQLKIALMNYRETKGDLNKYTYLGELHDRNEKLFYRLITEYIEEVMPIIYTPTVGYACQNFSRNYRRPRGMFFTINDKGHCQDMINNWPESDVSAICVTDGERILGLGDLGANGMQIPIGKLTLYTALGGVLPHQCLPVTLDVGTNNKALLEDEYYLGLRHPRVTGKEYYDFVDEFMEAVVARFGLETLIQFEDFGNHHAFKLLKKYQAGYCTFNDDIQGTAAVVLGGLYTTNRRTQRKMSENTMLFMGAGEAGLGVADLCCKAMESEGLGIEEARKKIWMYDVGGLVVRSRDDLTDMRVDFAQDHAPTKDFLALVKEIKPSILIGVSAQAGAFTPEVLQAMASFNERPVIFALSNPTPKAECTAQQAYDHTEGRAIFASGSPLPPVKYNGKTYHTSQGNNAYIFPGVGLGVINAKMKHIGDEVFIIAAKALANTVEEKTIALGGVYPPLHSCKEVSVDIGIRIMEYAYAEGHASMYPEPKDKEEYLCSKLYDYHYLPSTPPTWEWK